MPVSPTDPSIGQQIAEITRELTMRAMAAPRTRKGEGTTEAQAAYGNHCLEAARRVLLAVQNGTLAPRSGE